MSESPERRRAGGSPPWKVLCVPVAVRGPRAAGRIPRGRGLCVALPKRGLRGNVWGGRRDR